MKVFVAVLFCCILLTFMNPADCETLKIRTRILNDQYSKTITAFKSPLMKTTDDENYSENTIWRKVQDVAFKDGLYGAFAGSLQVITLMWLRTIVNYQYQNGVTMQEAIDELYHDGGIARFYQGITYAIIQNPLIKFGSVYSNEAARVVLQHIQENGNVNPMHISLLGTVFSVLWKLTLMPIETCKTILQVSGEKGFEQLMFQLKQGNIGRLYSGSIATMISTATSYYPWFYVYNLLDKYLSKSSDTTKTVFRSALIGFVASVVSDTVSNSIRVIKTIKQATAVRNDDAEIGYLEIIYQVLQEEGIVGLFGRGLLTRIFANGLQSILFTVVWRLLPLYLERRSSSHKKRENRSDSSSVLLAV